jgi:hypothetical protein
MPPTLAFTIGSYRLIDFIQLGLRQLRRLAPESAVLVSDDPSPESPMIQQITEQHGATYRGANTRRGHFSADFQALVNALSFAEAAKADVAVKISQRTILRKPESISVIQKVFEDPNIMAATPGQPVVTTNNRASKGFSAFTILSDIVMIRVGSMSPQDLLVMYRNKILRERTPWASFIELAVDDLHSKQFPGRTAKIPELTNPDKDDPIFLRRYQNTVEQYRNLAMTHGINGNYTLEEWGIIERQNYLCRPVVV